MTALPGAVVWDPPELDPWLDAGIDIMMAIHAVLAPQQLRRWEPYPPENVQPVWTRYRWAWERAVAAYHDDRPSDDRPSSDRVFVQRWIRASGQPDYHPYWDLLTAVSMSDDEPNRELDEFIAAAAQRL